MQIAAERLVKLQKSVDQNGGQQERHCQPHGINEKQQHTFGKRIFRCGEAQECSQNGTNAWGPAESKSKANQKSPHRRLSTFYFVQPFVSVESFDLEDASQM